MNVKKVLGRTAATTALVAVPLVAVVGTASADPIHDDRAAQPQAQPQFELPHLDLPQFELPNLLPQQPTPLPAPTQIPTIAPNFLQQFSTGSAG